MLQPGDTLGEYRIEGLLGRGGMATVYRAHQPSLARTVALKVLPSFFAEEEGFRERFQQEAIAIARLRHPSILVVFDYGEQDGMPYLVSEYIENGTLADRLGAPLSLQETLRLLAPIADALDFAHERGVVHRDVKPSNILIAQSDRPVLSDFGLAKLFNTQRRLTQTGMVLGTPEYMAPELAVDGAVGPSIDHYALAVIAYEMLTGIVPFGAATPQALLLAHLQEPVPPPRALNPSLSSSVEAVLLQGLAKSPGARYPSATAFVTALREAEQVADIGTAVLDTSDTTTVLAVSPATSEPTTALPSPAPDLLLRAPTSSSRKVPWPARIGAGVLALALAGGSIAVYETRSTPHAGAVTPGSWTAAGSLDAPVAFAEAVRLPDGNPLVLGGYGPDGGGTLTDEYDGTRATWITLPPLRTPRSQFTATELSDGQILVAGGDTGSTFTAGAELFDSRRHLWQRTGSLHTARRAHTAIRLHNGIVLVAGGEDAHYSPLRSVEIYNPATGTWASTSSAASVHFGDTGVLLSNGKVLLAGGGTSACELYDPVTGQWRAAAPLHHSRLGHTLTVLADGRVLAAGGADAADSNDQASAEIYDPNTDTWTPTGSMHAPRSMHTATLLADGTVLVAGGRDGKQMLASAERFDPATGHWTLVATMHARRSAHVAVAFDGGDVLIAGGISSSNTYSGTAEIYKAL